MPTNTEIVKCPVCSIDKQVGLVAHHICRAHIHDGRFDADLLTKITNTVGSGNYHPELAINGRTFTLCPAWVKEAKGFRHESKNKRSLQNQHEDCSLCYKGWMPQLTTAITVVAPVQQQQSEESKEDEQSEQSEQSEEQDQSHQTNPILETSSDDVATLHAEIVRLEAVVEQYRNWIKLAPQQTQRHIHQTQPPLKLLPAPEKQQVKQIQPPPRQPVARRTVKASKKELEKGMWCSLCASCNIIAQYTTDLRACATCKKLTHFNDDLNGCYHWDCEICKSKICKECNKSNGGNKMHPLCSEVCAKKYRTKRAE